MLNAIPESTDFRDGTGFDYPRTVLRYHVTFLVVLDGFTQRGNKTQKGLEPDMNWTK